ncbi:MAG: signal peptide peptidase SppA [Bacteroidales bacterium]|nr:signal peptide peptidase SppA [Bacteroidales bacterium]
MNEFEQNNSSYGKPETRSRKFWRVVFGSMLGFFFSMILVSILYMVMLISMIGTLASASKETTTIKNNSVLQLNLNQSVAERVIETPFDKFNTYNAQIGLNDILACIKNAATDPKIKGIYLNSATVGASPASVKEIHDALVEFKKYGKFIYAYSDVLAQNGYYLASVADKIILNPAGSLDFKGYAFQVMFYKGLIDKLDVDVQILRHGQFKSAVEPYMLDKMSEANREQLTVLSNSLWKVFVDDISAARKIPADSLNAIAENLLCATPEDALRLKMVDQLGYPGDMEKLLKSKLNVGEDDDINFVSISKYKKSIIENTKAAAKIAVVYAVGEISDGKGDNSRGIYSESFIKEFKKAYKDNDVKAIVLRINSPGGSALASENIWREIENAKKAGKIVVTSMDDYAASGGYYIACNSNYIIAQPNTLTGSIGVFGMIPSFQNLLKNKLGITVDVVKTNQHADYGTGLRPLDEIEMSTIQTSIEQIYSTFTKRVADGRKMTVAQVDSIGQGRVWAGVDALNLGLVDKLGNIDDAIAKAAELAKISNYSIVYYPKQKDWFTLLFSNDDELEAALKTKLGSLYFTYEGIDHVLNQKGIQARIPMEITIY